MSRSPLDHPEIKKLFHKLASVLIAESDGGAVLIGTAHVEEPPKELFESSIFTSLFFWFAQQVVSGVARWEARGFPAL
jgi:hypothetical protein